MGSGAVNTADGKVAAAKKTLHVDAAALAKAKHKAKKLAKKGEKGAKDKLKSAEALVAHLKNKVGASEAILKKALLNKHLAKGVVAHAREVVAKARAKLNHAKVSAGVIRRAREKVSKHHGKVQAAKAKLAHA